MLVILLRVDSASLSLLPTTRDVRKACISFFPKFVFRKPNDCFFSQLPSLMADWFVSQGVPSVCAVCGARCTER